MNTTDYNDFLQQFKAQAQELENALSTRTLISKDIEQISLSLTKLRTGLTEAVSVGILPSYDHELCQQRLTALEESLSKARAASKPKSKFSFKSTANTRPATVASTPKPKPVELPTASSTAEIALTGHAHKYLTLQNATGATLNDVQSLVITIKGLSDCFVDLTRHALALIT
ncbi:tubulin-specific chaperone C [Ceratobasidium sp. AG-Ba]|nr:tubulin-specific chaperone C [Ceratobasidium sp. AG-Ba]QRV91657.1 tubulin-specific chaperone C [Ceratobasidium sp. AG-Ba]